MKKFSLLFALLPCGLLAQTCPAGQTAISDTILNPSNTGSQSLFNGRVTIFAPSVPISAGTTTFTREPLTVTVTLGVFFACLAPNDTASPPGTSYTVQYAGNDGFRWAAIWVVPTSAGAVAIQAVQQTTQPSVLASYLTTTGDLLSYTTRPVRVGIGPNGTAPTADSTQATGWAWKNPIELTNLQAGTTYTFTNSDCGHLTVFSSNSSLAATLPQAGASGNFLAGCVIELTVIGSASLTLTPTVSMIAGQTSLTVAQNQGVRIISDGTNYQVVQPPSVPCFGSNCTAPIGSTLAMYAGTFANNQVMGFRNQAGNGNAGRVYCDTSNNCWFETISSGNTLNLQSTGGSVAIKSGNNTLYRCTVAGTLRAGQLTSVPGDCGTAQAIGLLTQ